MYERRAYRDWKGSEDLDGFTATVKETDLFIRADKNIQTQAIEAIIRHRTPLEKYIEENREFLTSLEPVQVAPTAPEIVKIMAEAGARAGVGPMAAVAGTLAELVGNDLLKFSREIIVENGGDIFLKIRKQRSIGIYAGKSPFTGQLTVEIEPDETPLGVCTSAGTVGHSLSFGKADAVTVMAESAALADAAATAIGNCVKSREDIQPALEFGGRIEKLRGIIIIVGDKIGCWGSVRLGKGGKE